MTHLKPHNARLVSHGSSGSIDDVPFGLVAYVDTAGTWRLGFVAYFPGTLTSWKVLLDDYGHIVQGFPAPDYTDATTLLHPMRMELDHPGRAREQAIREMRDAIAAAMSSLHAVSQMLEDACRV